MTKQITLSTTPTMILSEDQARTSFSIVNADSAITVYIGRGPDVSSIVGFPLFPRQTMSKGKGYGDDPRRAVWAVAASDTPTVATMEEYGV